VDVARVPANPATAVDGSGVVDVVEVADVELYAE